MKWNDLAAQSCPVARGLSVVGDRWTLLILRECFLGVHRFEAMHERLGLTRHVLAERLRKLEADGVLMRQPYQDRPLRHDYHLTPKGEALYPVIVTLIGWAEAHVPAEAPSRVALVRREDGARVQPRLIDGASGIEITHHSVQTLVRADQA